MRNAECRMRNGVAGLDGLHRGYLCGPFPLTLALSPRERETGIQSVKSQER